MKIESNKLHYIFTYTIYSASFFVLGLILVNILPETSYIYQGILRSFSEIEVVYSNKNLFDSTLLFSLFTSELKYLIFIFISCLCVYRNLIIIVINSYKGFVTGIGCALFVRIISLNTQSQTLAFITSLLYIILSLCLIFANTLFSTDSMLYSRRIIIPVKITTLLKRKDTYSQLFKLLVFCGAIFIITLIKMGTLLYTVS